MRTIIILATYVGVVNRGAETFVIELVKKLRTYYNVEVYSLGTVGDIEENITVVNSETPFWFNLHSWIYYNFYLYKVFCDKLFILIPTIIEQHYFTKKVYETYLRGRTDIDLMFPNNGYSGAKLANFMRVEGGIPFIYTGHGGIGEGERKILLKRPDSYIALNETHYNWAKTYHNGVVKISNGVDVTKFKPKTLNKSNDNFKSILCVGALVQLKRQKLLIDALATLDNVKLVLLGKGEMQNELEKYAEAKIKGRWEITSASYDDIHSYYDKCDLFSLPTKEEPFGIVYLEALSMNKAIVAPDDESRREIIGEAGLFCDVENSSIYAKTIQKALEINWEDIPRNRAITKFDWSIVSAKYKDLIDGIVK